MLCLQHFLQTQLAHSVCFSMAKCNCCANHIVFNHMDAYHLYMLGHSYVESPDYLVVKAWIRATFLHPSFINLAGTNIYVYVEIFPSIVGY